MPQEVALEIANYIRSAVFVPLSNNLSILRESCTGSMVTQKEVLRDVQLQISTVIEPTAAELVPVAMELKDVYQQIDLLEKLVNKVQESIKAMEKKVEKTEQAVRREERALDEGKPIGLWEGQSRYSDGAQKFRAADWVRGGKLRDPLQEAQQP
ncbi:hypothetical protein BJ508DRAFT_138264 [Ascobolus immersus RN42]|uniref:Uncharacterized protein n=1 Tax=Ascobolus immersus RN42 TaxID=1160509 RepID=A0A3N4IDG6_ASCIM|nr:hypothetical protein BJ508DRAFT_138264 [Ascobolus immersus RN42]